jgi:hypothetical protein
MHFNREYMPKADIFEGKSGEKQRRTGTFITRNTRIYRSSTTRSLSRNAGRKGAGQTIAKGSAEFGLVLRIAKKRVHEWAAAVKNQAVAQP